MRVTCDEGYLWRMVSGLFAGLPFAISPIVPHHKDRRYSMGVY
jgi:hypothetical protein